MRYIDAKKLIAEIEMRREKCADVAADERNEEVAEYYRGKEVAYDETSTLITFLQQGQPSEDLEKTEKLDTTMLTYAAEVFSGKTLLEDISYSYRKELAVYFNGLVETAKED